jgi:hypothetical protein
MLVFELIYTCIQMVTFSPCICLCLFHIYMNVMYKPIGTLTSIYYIVLIHAFWMHAYLLAYSRPVCAGCPSEMTPSLWLSCTLTFGLSVRVLKRKRGRWVKSGRERGEGRGREGGRDRDKEREREILRINKGTGGNARNL